jgi:hypothetical protein
VRCVRLTSRLRTPCRIGRSRSSLRRLHADRDQWRVGGGHFDTARGLPLVEERRRVVRRPAIGADQHLIAAARGRTFSAQAIVAHDPQARTLRSLWTLRPRRAGRTHRARWTGDARIPFRSLQARLARVALGPLAASAKPECCKLPVGRDPRYGSRGAQKCDIETARSPRWQLSDCKFDYRQARAPTGLIADAFKC